MAHLRAFRQDAQGPNFTEPSCRAPSTVSSRSRRPPTATRGRRQTAPVCGARPQRLGQHTALRESDGSSSPIVVGTPDARLSWAGTHRTQIRRDQALADRHPGRAREVDADRRGLGHASARDSVLMFCRVVEQHQSVSEGCPGVDGGLHHAIGEPAQRRVRVVVVGLAAPGGSRSADSGTSAIRPVNGWIGAGAVSPGVGLGGGAILDRPERILDILYADE